MRDAAAVAWKEWRELVGQSGFGGWQGILLFLAAFGVVLPLMNGPAWVGSPAVALGWSWAPMFLVMTVIADAFAGERERHTLETLLASRLSERSMLFGKVAAAVAYAAALSGASLLLGLVTVNVAHRGSGLLLYPPPVLGTMAVLGLLGAVLVAAVGVLISLRAATVRQAQQTLGGAIMILLLAPVAAWRILPVAWTHVLATHAGTLTQRVVLGALLLAALDAVALGLAMRRFQRPRLIAS
jgi:ABC-2 type transport system permease protein